MDGMRLSGKCPEARYCPFPKVSAECPEGVRAKRGKCPERVRNVSGRQSSGAGRTPPFYKGVLSDPVAPLSSRVPNTGPRPAGACLARALDTPPNSAAHPTVSRPHMRRAA
jgi:hypothetical protein